MPERGVAIAFDPDESGLHRDPVGSFIRVSFENFLLVPSRTLFCAIATAPAITRFKGSA